MEIRQALAGSHTREGGRWVKRVRSGKGQVVGTPLAGWAGEVLSQGWPGPLFGVWSCLRHGAFIFRAETPVSEGLRHFMALPAVSKGKVKFSNSSGFQVS